MRDRHSFSLRFRRARRGLILGGSVCALMAPASAVAVQAAAQPAPAMNLDPTEGPPYTQIRVSVTNDGVSECLAANGQPGVVWIWLKGEDVVTPGEVQSEVSEAKTATVRSDGTWEGEVLVPPGWEPGPSTVEGVCRDSTGAAIISYPPVPFTVTPSPQMNITPTQGPGGAEVIVESIDPCYDESGFAGGHVVVSLQDGDGNYHGPYEADAGTDGSWSLALTVPAGQPADEIDVYAVCHHNADHQTHYQSLTFSLTESPTQPGPGPAPRPWPGVSQPAQPISGQPRYAG